MEVTSCERSRQHTFSSTGEDMRISEELIYFLRFSCSCVPDKQNEPFVARFLHLRLQVAQLFPRMWWSSIAQRRQDHCIGCNFAGKETTSPKFGHAQGLHSSRRPHCMCLACIADLTLNVQACRQLFSRAMIPQTTCRSERTAAQNFTHVVSEILTMEHC